MSLNATTEIATVQLDEPDRARITAVTGAAMARYDRADQQEFLENGFEYSRELPYRLAAGLTAFRDREQHSGLLIRGLAVDDGAIGATPEHWQQVPEAPAQTSTRREEFVLALVAESLGTAFGYATLQQGRLFHHLLPIRGNENEQNGHGSEAELVWHSEDAFTPARCDFLVLMGLRNPDSVGTLFAPASALASLPQRTLDILSQPRFVVRADDEHLKHVEHGFSDFGSIHATDLRRSTGPVIHGGADRPYLVIDKAFMSARPGDHEARLAYSAAVACLDQAVEHVALDAGDILVIDNNRAVHGRAPFHARYDGSDRWLLKLSVTRDLMKSRQYRKSATSRVVY